MMRWSDVDQESPELAKRVQTRFDLFGLALMATLRADGWPRVSGVEPFFSDGELWLGMMDGSRKGADLRRDPRLTLHAATADKQVTEGDAKISGIAVEVTGAEAKRAFLARFSEQNGYGPPEDSPMDLFTVDVTEISTLVPAGGHLDIEWWKQGNGTKRVKRA